MSIILHDIGTFLLWTAEPLKHLGVWGYPAILLIALAESTIIIGTMIPGSVGIIFAGLLAARGYYNYWALVLFSATGGIIGDYISYYIGSKGEHFFKAEAKILKKAHLERGKRFFDKYGDKSILIGRFLGAFRPIIPFVAGISKMDKKVFFSWNVISAFVWVLFHLSIGYFFGTSLKAIQGWSVGIGLFFLFLVLGVVFVELVLEHRVKLFAFIDRKTNQLLTSVARNTYIGSFIKNHPKLIAFIKNRFKRHNFSGLPLTLLAVIFCYLLIIFAGIAEQISELGIVSNFDERVLNFAIHFYHPHFVKWVVWFTSLGGEIIVPLVAIVSVIILLYRKRKNYAYALIFTGLFSEIFMLAGKEFFHRIRPVAQLINETSYSFPSGHATLSFAVYGFITYIIWRLAKKEKFKVWTTLLLGILILLIGLSRLYLRVHYFSDVAGGFILGGLCLVAGITLSEYFLAKKNK